MSERLTEQQLALVERSAADTKQHYASFGSARTSTALDVCDAAPLMVAEIRERRAADLRDEQREIIDAALGIYSSDYNDVPHDEIEVLRNLMKGRQA